MIRQNSLLLTTALSCLLLTSCATMNQPVVAPEKTAADVEPASWAAAKKQRQQIIIWEIRGRLGVQTAEQGGAMDIIWKQSGEEFSIRLIAPLGAGTYLVQGDDSYAVIRYPDGTKKTIDDINKVFKSTLDVDLPVTAIKDWIRGLPAAELSTKSISWNEKHLLHRLKQSGWNVEMTRYTGNKIPMPHALYVTRDDDEALDVRLLLRQWLIDN